jgi:hypothetical protein
VFHEDRWRTLIRAQALDNQFSVVVARNRSIGSCMVTRQGEFLAWKEEATRGLALPLADIPRLEQNRWYRLRFIVAGRRLHGSIDGRTVFDLIDDPYGNNGPVYNFGRQRITKPS